MGKREICKAALEHWGKGVQTLTLFEEMGELQQAISKAERFPRERKMRVDNIAEEIADVRIMLTQMAILYDVEKDAIRWEDRKLERLEKLIAGDRFA